MAVQKRRGALEKKGNSHRDLEGAWREFVSQYQQLIDVNFGPA
jgi:hypothetical protein